MTLGTVGAVGLPLTSWEWLAAHHAAKRHEREKIISMHGLHRGDRVLDIACGPGFWLPLLADAIGPEGCVVGLDIDSSLIAQAKAAYRELDTQVSMEFHVGDMRSLPFPDDFFDVVLCGNAYNYVPEEEIKGIFYEHLRVLRPGGKLIARAFDNTSTIFHPIPPTLQLSIMYGVAASLKHCSDFDNYFGQKMHSVMERLNEGTLETHTFVTQKVPPLCAASKDYIRMKAVWYAERAEGHCPHQDLMDWRKFFDPTSSSFVIDRRDFFFVTLEMISTLFKPRGPA